MSTVLIVAPVFALIAAGYVAVLFRFVSETANKGISEFAFSIAIPALLFRTIVISEFPSVSAFQVWGAYYGALALVWFAALLISRLLRQEREDGPVFAIGSVYGNIVMLGIPLTLSGHTHGGQVRFLGWAPIVPSRYGNRYAYGHVREAGRDLVVSGGIGTSQLPIRFGIPPEIVLIELG